MKDKAKYTKSGLLIVVIILQAIILLAILAAFGVNTTIFQGTETAPIAGNSNLEVIKAKIELLEKHESWTIALLAISFTIIAILFGLLQYFFAKTAEENVYKNLAKLANEDKDAFKKAIEVRAIEIELMREYPIYIIYNRTMTDMDKSKSLYMLLSSYRFENIKRITYQEAFQKQFCDKSILVFCEDSFNREGFDLIINRNPDVAVFGLGKGFSIEGVECINYANSFSSVFNNLMSLLHYKRYLINIQNSSLTC